MKIKEVRRKEAEYRIKPASCLFDRETCQVFVAPFDVRLPLNNEKDDETLTVVQPDILVICDRSKIDKRGCVGAPDLIIEISSPYTAKKDWGEKFLLYERAGVKEYWIVHPLEKTVLVYKLGENKTYGRHEIYSVEDIVRVRFLEDLEINLKEVFMEG